MDTYSFFGSFGLEVARQPSLADHLFTELGFAVAARQKAGLDTPAYLLSHISPLGWAHIILTGEYRWTQMAENP